MKDSTPHSSFNIVAPGRINLIGEHVDYQDGFVLPVAVDRHITGTFTPLNESVIRLTSEERPGETFECNSDDLRVRTGDEHWINYVIGVVAMYQTRGINCPGFSAHFQSTLPAGAGLSSSAALEMTTALAVEQLTGTAIPAPERALLCQRAEHEYAGVPCGIMDQLAVACGQSGHALMIDCRDLNTTPVPLPKGMTLVVADSGVKHALGDGEYRLRREDCETASEILGVNNLRDATKQQIEAQAEALGDQRYRRARHVVREIARVEEFVTALQADDQAAIGRLMLESHESLRDDFEVSCAELDVLVEAAYAFGLTRGCIGSRLTGGGFGGSTISLVRDDAVDAFKKHLTAGFQAKFDRSPTIFSTQASDGARVVDVQSTRKI